MLFRANVMTWNLPRNDKTIFDFDENLSHDWLEFFVKANSKESVLNYMKWRFRHLTDNVENIIEVIESEFDLDDDLLHCFAYIKLN